MDEATFLTADEIGRALVDRMGPVHARQRLGIERDHEAQAFGQGLTFFRRENMKTSNLLIEAVLRLSGTYWRGRANAAKVRVRHNDIRSARLPSQFDGLTILHVSDLHADMSADAMAEAARLVDGLHYDLCVLTGTIVDEHSAPTSPAFATCWAFWRLSGERSMA